MAAKASPITASVLDWAIREDGRSRTAIAGQLKVDQPTLDLWATGESQPTVGQVSDLARVLHRTRVFFFLPGPPEKSAIPDGFRHPPGGAGRDVPANVLRQARRAKRIQLAMASTVPDEGRPQIPKASIEDSPQHAAQRARDWLELPPTARWKDDYEALRWWKTTLERVGVLVFDLQLGKEAPRGFAGWDERAPMIVLNSTETSAAARIFTIGHELGHLLLRQATACLEPKGSALSVDNRTEKWCERFAAALIMPMGEIRQLMTELGVAMGEATITAVKSVMTTFRVSARAAAVRLTDLAYAADGLYAAVLKVFKTSTQESSGTPHNPPRHQMRLRQYGPATVGTILESLTPSDAMSVLRLTVDDVRSLADEGVPGVPAV